jgi:antitoxin CcdA
MLSGTRKAVNLSLDAELLKLARELDINLSRAAASGIAKAVKAERERRWLEGNAEAIEAYNHYIAKNGLPLEEYRTF